MRGSAADVYGVARGQFATRAARVLIAGSRPGVVANASIKQDQTAAVGIGPASVWSGPSRARVLGQPILSRERKP